MIALPNHSIELNVNNKRILKLNNAEIEYSAMLLGGNPVYPRINFKWGISELSIPIEKYSAEISEETARLNIAVSEGWEAVFLNLS